MGISFKYAREVERGHLPDLGNPTKFQAWLGELGAGDEAQQSSVPVVIADHLRTDPLLPGAAAQEIVAIVRDLYEALWRRPASSPLHLRAARTFTPDAANGLADLLARIRQPRSPHLILPKGFKGDAERRALTSRAEMGLEPTEPPADDKPAPTPEPETTDAPPDAVAVIGLAAITTQTSPVPSTTAAPSASVAPSPSIDRESARWAAIRSILANVLDVLRWVILSTPGEPVPIPSASPDPSDVRPPRSGGPSVPPRYGSAGGPFVAGIDVSHWNGVVPFGLVRGTGARFVLMKATQGTTFVDPAFSRHLASARAAGLVVGPYHFYDYRIGGRAQADHMLDTLAEVGGLPRSLPLVIDVECFPPFGAADQAYVRVQLRAFVGRIYERTGRLPMFYTSWYMWRNVTGGDPSFGDLPLWVACWRCARPALPTGWVDWDFWQVGSVVIDATGDRLGSDIFGGDAEELRHMSRPLRTSR